MNATEQYNLKMFNLYNNLARKANQEYERSRAADDMKAAREWHKLHTEYACKAAGFAVMIVRERQGQEVEK